MTGSEQLNFWNGLVYYAYYYSITLSHKSVLKNNLIKNQLIWALFVATVTRRIHMHNVDNNLILCRQTNSQLSRKITIGSYIQFFRIVLLTSR